MEPIRVIVQGALGKVGREIVIAVCRDTETKIVGAVDIDAKNTSLSLPDGSGEVPISKDINEIHEKCPADVLVDFTVASATMPAARATLTKGVNMVIGTTGLSEDELTELENLTVDNNAGVVIAPNFALGAVLMMHLARIAAKYMEFAEIIELHHNQKADAPSGTALLTARGMAEERGNPFPDPYDSDKNFKSRGQVVEGVPIHAIRLPGLMAHQEVILGTAGQTLSIRHDTINRECYTPGVLYAVKDVVKRKGFTYGLDVLLGL
ncbi:MAG: 4-hydroxy-tetrahydrodipicolinate reductase [Dehalococcoidales bacterium]|nr:MAG: 4-hydroxy-tetrahydrodipicolinate reductase [Dehalococcoidales bacterium]